MLLPRAALSFVKEDNAWRCFDGKVQCPDRVTPSFLEEAKNQLICTEERDKYFCRHTCTDNGESTWLGSPCPDDGVSPCPPWPRTKLPGYKPEVPVPNTKIVGPEPQQPDNVPVTPPKKLRTNGQALYNRAAQREKEWIDKLGGFNLRGIAVWRHAVQYQHTACLH